MPTSIDGAKVRALYDQARYLDAYQLTAPAWSEPEWLASLSAPDLVFAGRLATRLGGAKIGRFLFRTARARAPRDPQVLYFTRGELRSRWSLLEQLRFFANERLPDDVEPWLRASWHASYAHLLGLARDFEAAHVELRTAFALEIDRPWVQYCEAEVLLAEDRPADALVAAEAGWALLPHHPALTEVLGRALTKLSRAEEAYARMAQVLASGQSYEAAHTALHYLCARVERAADETRPALAAAAEEAVGRVEALAPLADRQTRMAFANSRARVALLREGDGVLPEEGRVYLHPFFRKVRDNLAKNRGATRRLLPFAAVFQGHDTCLPASTSAVAAGLGMSVDQDDLAGALTYAGTAVWRVAKWLRERGCGVKSFVVTAELATTLLDAGLPFIYLTQSLSSAHAVAAVGVDRRAETLILHDPSQLRLDFDLLAQLGDHAAPIGPGGLAFTVDPADPRLSLIPDDTAVPAAAWLDWCEAFETGAGLGHAAPIVDRLAERFPNHPTTRRMRALALHMRGESSAAIEAHWKLLEEFPGCIPLQRDLLDSVHGTRNSAEIRRVLEMLVAQGFRAGHRANSLWEDTPGLLLAQLADFIGVTSDSFARAEVLLWRAMTQEPMLADSYHILGDVLARQRKKEEALLPFRVAASMRDENDHYARAHADALADVGREAEGLALLERRAVRLGTKALGHGALDTWVAALEDYGHPIEAAAAMRQAEADHPTSTHLGSLAVGFWARMGEWEAAEAALGRVESAGGGVLYLEAAVALRRARGQWKEALRLCEAWRREAPASLPARRIYLTLLAHDLGKLRALDEARRWTSERPGDDSLEDLLFDLLVGLDKDDEALALVQARIARNPKDPWACREVGFRLAGRLELLPPEQRGPRLAELETTATHAFDLAPHEPGSFTLRARLAQLRGDYAEVFTALRQALERAPELGWAYDMAFRWIDELPAAEQPALVAWLESTLLRTPGRLFEARRLCFAISRRYGMAAGLAAVQRWRSERPLDPSVVEAEADLLLEHGHGKSDAQRAALLLDEALRRFPSHHGLRFSLAMAHHALEDRPAEEAVLREILRRFPLNTASRLRLARLWAQSGRVSEATAELEAATELTPLDINLWQGLAELYEQLGNPSAAIGTLRTALSRLPESVALRRRLIDSLAAAGAHGEAIAVALRGTEIYPTGAYMWCLYADQLANSPEHTDLREAETAYRTALSYNAELFDAADALAILLARLRRFDEARLVLEPQRRGEPAATAARIAWVDREAGQHESARKAMADVTRRWPSHLWPWWRYMDWAEDDQAWSEAREVLREVPAVLANNPEYRSRRLLVLQRAGVAAADLAAEWDRLVADFPEEVNLHLRRFDLALDAGSFDVAATALERLERSDPHSPFVLARRVMLACKQDRLDEAVSIALRVWKAPGEDEPWPDGAAFRALNEAGGTPRAAQALLETVKAGERVRLEALQQILNADGKALPQRVSLYEQLLELFDAAAWPAQRHTAAVIARLGEVGDKKALVKRWEQNKERYRADTATWQAIGALLTDVDRRAAQSWLADWRDRPDVEMWAVANWVYSHRAAHRLHAGAETHLPMVLRACRDALSRLPHDWTVRYLATNLGEAALRLGQDDELRDVTTRFAVVLGDDGPRYWMPGAYRWAPKLIAWFGRLSQTSDIASLGTELARLRVPAGVRWLTGTLWHRLRGRLSVVARAWLWLRVTLLRPW